MRPQSQFSLRVLLSWTTLFAAYCALLASFDNCREPVGCWTIAGLGAWVAWLPGGWVGRSLGPLARHASAMVFAAVGATCAFLVLSEERFPEVLQTVVFATSLIRGTVIATGILVITATSDLLETLREQPTHPDSPAVLTSLPDEVAASAIVTALAKHGVNSLHTGGFTAAFRAEAPGVVNVVVRHEDLGRARSALVNIETENHEYDEPRAESLGRKPW